MKYELKANQGIPASLLVMLSIATGLSVANCYYNQPLLGSIATDFKINDLSANAVATLTQVGYMLGLLFVIPLGDLLSRRKLILTNYVLAACSLLAIGTAQDIRIVWVASLITGATSVMPQFFIPLVSYHSAPSHKTRNFGLTDTEWTDCQCLGVAHGVFHIGRTDDVLLVYDVQSASRIARTGKRNIRKADEVAMAYSAEISIPAHCFRSGGIGLWRFLCLMELPCLQDEASPFFCRR